MHIIPAIDLYDGKCVRLLQGKFAAVTTYEHDPVSVAQDYAAQGATRLHVVDLNGAQQGHAQQLETILAIKAATPLQIQVGGGIRSITSAVNLLEQGIDRIVIGSMAVTDPANTLALLEQYGAKRIILALDVIIDSEPYVTINGWQNPTSFTLWDILANYAAIAELQVLCTDISKDGGLTGPNIALYQDCVARYPGIYFIASGGVSNLNDLTQLNCSGVDAVVIGKALYEKRFSLSEAINEVVTC